MKVSNSRRLSSLLRIPRTPSRLSRRSSVHVVFEQLNPELSALDRNFDHVSMRVQAAAW
jgi:hypothetical protein